MAAKELKHATVTIHIKVIVHTVNAKHNDTTNPMCNVNAKYRGKTDPLSSVSTKYSGKISLLSSVSTKHSGAISPLHSVNAIGVKTAGEIVVTGQMTVRANND